MARCLGKKSRVNIRESPFHFIFDNNSSGFCSVRAAEINEKTTERIPNIWRKNRRLIDTHTFLFGLRKQKRALGLLHALSS